MSYPEHAGGLTIRKINGKCKGVWTFHSFSHKKQKLLWTFIKNFLVVPSAIFNLVYFKTELFFLLNVYIYFSVLLKVETSFIIYLLVDSNKCLKSQLSRFPLKQHLLKSKPLNSYLFYSVQSTLTRS